MSTRDSTKKILYDPHFSARQLIGILAMSIATIILLVCGTLLALTLITPMAQAGKNASRNTPLTTHMTSNTASVETKQAAVLTPLIKPTVSNTPQSTPQQTATQTRGASATPTLIASTPQSSQAGVFSLASGGPLPVPQSVLHPTNIARVMLNGTLTSVYAGSLAQNPQAGVLCVLRENLTTGQIALQMYQSPRPEGPLTILSVQNTMLKIADPKAQGSFDLSTNQFQW